MWETVICPVCARCFPMQSRAKCTCHALLYRGKGARRVQVYSDKDQFLMLDGKWRKLKENGDLQ